MTSVTVAALVVAFVAGTAAGIAVAAVLHASACASRSAQMIEVIEALRADRDRWRRIAEGDEQIVRSVRRLFDIHDFN